MNPSSGVWPLWAANRECLPERWQENPVAGNGCNDYLG
nr:MAG TPA: hypothetical protein [Caudoviricetes sp.]